MAFDQRLLLTGNPAKRGQHAAKANDHITLGELYIYIGNVQTPYTYLTVCTNCTYIREPCTSLLLHPAPCTPRPPTLFPGGLSFGPPCDFTPIPAFSTLWHLRDRCTDYGVTSRLLRTSSSYRFAVTVAITYCTAPSFELVYSDHEFQYFTVTRLTPTILHELALGNTLIPHYLN